MKTVSPEQDCMGIEEMGSEELALPSSVHAALGEWVNAPKDGLLAPSVGIGLEWHSTHPPGQNLPYLQAKRT